MAELKPGRPIDPRWRVGAFSPTGARELVVQRVRLLRLLRAADRRWLSLAFLTWAALATAPSWMAFSSGHLISVLVRGPENVGLSAALLWPAISVGAAIAVMGAASSAQTLVERCVADQIDGRIRSDIRRIAGLQLPVPLLESREVRDDIIAAGDPGGSSRNRTAGAAAVGQATVTARMASALLACLVITTISVPLALFLLATTLVSRVLVRRQWIYLAQLDDELSGSHTEREDIEGYLTKSRYAREVWVFRLSNWLIDRWRQLDAPRQIYAEEHGRVIRRQVLTSILTFAVGVGGFVIPGLLTSAGELSVEQLSRCLVATMLLFSISFMGNEAFDIDYGYRACAAYHRIVARSSSLGREERITSSPPMLGRTDRRSEAPAICVKNVSFAYPGSTGRVLDGLNLEIAAGETVGVVGQNGSGKTTLTKLLTGLYQPNVGAVGFIGGASTHEVTALYQDFIRYPLSVRENIALGHPGPADDDVIAWCADVAGVTQQLAKDGLSLSTELWSTESGRPELSGGQWQRIALARVLYAARKGCGVVLLDEPTAHLDVNAERRFHDQVLSILHDVTVLLITHRLSTIRRVNRVALLQDGRIAELGSHEELMDLDGKYAALFRLQADQDKKGGDR